MSYVLSLQGFLRLALIVSQTAGWISMAALLKVNVDVSLTGYEWFDVRTTFLVFFVIGTFLSIVILVLGQLNKLPPKLSIQITDVLWLIATLVLASFAASEESKYGNVTSVINKGAFGVASAFGFLTAILYLVDAIVLSKSS